MMNKHFIRRSNKRVKCKIIGDFINCLYEIAIIYSLKTIFVLLVLLRRETLSSCCRRKKVKEIDLELRMSCVLKDLEQKIQIRRISKTKMNLQTYFFPLLFEFTLLSAGRNSHVSHIIFVCHLLFFRINGILY